MGQEEDAAAQAGRAVSDAPAEDPLQEGLLSGTSLAGFTAVVCAVTATATPIYLVGAAAVQMRSSLGFTVAELGVVVACGNLASVLTARLAGGIAERIGGVRTVRIAALFSAVALLVIAVWVTSWPELAAVLVLGGTAASMGGIGSNLFLARRVNHSRQGLAFGIKQSSGPLALMVSGVFVSAVAITIGWRWAFGVASGLTLAIMVLIPRSRTPLRARLRQRSGRGTEPLRPLAVLAAGHGLALASCASLAAFVVSCCVHAGVGSGAAGLAVVGVSIASVCARVASGNLADRRGQHHFEVVAIMMACGSLGFLILGIGSGTALPWLIVAGALVSGGLGWGWNGVLSFAVVESHPVAPARATSILRTGARTGSVVGPLAFGLIVTRFGYGMAWYVASAEAVMGALVILLGGRMVRGTRVSAIAIRQRGDRTNEDLR